MPDRKNHSPASPLRCRAAVCALLTLAVLTGSAPAAAQSGRMRGSPQGSGERGGEALKPSDLQVVFPASARCAGIASAFGANTRYDGSTRSPAEFGGRHGGIDISLEDGTPLLAIAAGTVVSAGTGGQMEGNFVWLRHAPEDTGVDYGVFSKYQHLRTPSELTAGSAVAAGQLVGYSGATGTTGGHYGATGYAHLHLTTVRATSTDATVGARGEARGVTLFDPLRLFADAAASLGPAIAVPVRFTDGRLQPAGARVVWPVACAPR